MSTHETQNAEGQWRDGAHPTEPGWYEFKGSLISTTEFALDAYFHDWNRAEVFFNEETQRLNARVACYADFIGNFHGEWRLPAGEKVPPAHTVIDPPPSTVLEELKAITQQLRMLNQTLSQTTRTSSAGGKVLNVSIDGHPTRRE